MRTAADAAYEVIRGADQPGSPKRLQTVLFDKLDMPKTKKTKTGYTTDADALQGLYEKTEHPFLAHLLEHRDATRLRVTVDGLLKSVADDDRIHHLQPDGRGHRTVVLDHPNLQNILNGPHQAGRQIRNGFVVGTAGAEPIRDIDDGRLQPDRDADHGAPVGRRGSDRGVPTPVRTTTSSARGRSGVPIDEVTTEMRHRVKGHVVRTRLRPQRFRPRGGSAQSARARPKSRWISTSPGSAESATICGTWSTRPAPTSTPQRFRAPQAARPQQRQLAAQTVGRTDGTQRAQFRAPPPTSSRSR